MICIYCRTTGSKSVYLVIIDGGADWVAAEHAVTAEFPWIHFLRCVAHEGSLIVKDICSIPPIEDLLKWMTDAQHWFQTSKLRPLLKAFCIEHYGTERSFIFPADTRFAGKLLQIKRFLDMKEALQQCVSSAQYLRFDFVDDIFANRITSADDWNLMSRIVKTCGPILLLLRLADSNSGSLSKLRGIVDYITKKMMTLNAAAGTLEGKICTAFLNRAPELECDISNAAWIIDPQFVHNSRKASPSVMRSFWEVSRKVMRVTDESVWRQQRADMVTELAKFRMKTGGFTVENYNNDDTCSFWSVAGCHAPILRELAMRLAPLPCSSGEAERNWFELKQNKTKTHNKLGKDTVAKMIFVRRFIRLKRKVCMDESCVAFKKWSSDLLKEVMEDNVTGSSSSGDDDDNASRVFNDMIEAGEQARINGREPGKPEMDITLTELKRSHASKSWLFNKYYNMSFVDKNPEGGANDTPLEESEWEHRVIKDVVWWRRKGWCVETCLRGTVAHQSIVNYQINSTLHEMIRNSSHNVRPMFTATTDDNSAVDTESESNNSSLFDTDSDE